MPWVVQHYITISFHFQTSNDIKVENSKSNCMQKLKLLHKAGKHDSSSLLTIAPMNFKFCMKADIRPI